MQREAIQAVEQDGIVFIDEIDKIVVNQDLRYGEAPVGGHTVTVQPWSSCKADVQLLSSARSSYEWMHLPYLVSFRPLQHTQKPGWCERLGSLRQQATA